jgi:oligosaccharide translocation protein RFT1
MRVDQQSIDDESNKDVDTIQYFRNIKQLFILPVPAQFNSAHSTSNSASETTSPLPSSLHINQPPMMYLHAHSLSLAVQFFIQSFEKLLLTEGEKFVFVSVTRKSAADLDQQGVYSVVQNLGSLVARFVFQPLEEVALNEFGLIASANANAHANANVTTTTTTYTTNQQQRQRQQNHQQHSQQQQQHDVLLQLLANLVKLVTIIGLIFISFGPSFAYILLHILYGSSWTSTSAPTALSAYCVYILLMAVNGITEAFVCATVSSKQLSEYNKMLVLFSWIYIASCYCFLGYGVVGVIAANCVGMITRILYSLTFIRQYFHINQPSALSLMVPSKFVFLVCILSFFLTQTSMHTLQIEQIIRMSYWVLHIAIGVICLIGTLYVIWRFEGSIVTHLSMLKPRKMA